MEVKADEMIRKLVSVAYPEYNGRKFRIEVTEGPVNCASYWSGGSRDYFAFVRLQDCATIPMPAQSAFDARIAGAEAVRLQAGIVIIERSYFRGKDSGITIYVHPANSNMLALPAPKAELTWSQQVVLIATCSLKSSYGGISNYRFHEARQRVGITTPEWDTAKAELQAMKFLNAAGAVTSEGRNLRDTLANKYDMPKRESALVLV